jgi:Flp pilus assembly protein TadG
MNTSATSIGRARRGERGTQIAEFAVILPLLAFLALVVTEGAGLVRTHQLLNNLAREGARVATVNENLHNAYLSDPSPAIVGAMNAYAQNNGISLPALTEGGTAPAGGCSAGSGYCFNWTGTSNGNWNCSSFTVTIDQDVTMPGPNGVDIKASRVLVTCAYRLQYLPNLPFFGVSKLITLKGSAEFRNLQL